LGKAYGIGGHTVNDGLRVIQDGIRRFRGRGDVFRYMNKENRPAKGAAPDAVPYPAHAGANPADPRTTGNSTENNGLLA